MNILDAIVNAQDGAAVRQLGSQVGLRPDQTTAALSALVPALAQHNVSPLVSVIVTVVLLKVAWT